MRRGTAKLSQHHEREGEDGALRFPGKQGWIGEGLNSGRKHFYRGLSESFQGPGKTKGSEDLAVVESWPGKASVPTKEGRLHGKKWTAA